MSKTIKKIGVSIRKYRNQIGYSQNDVAKIISTSKSYISSLENGKRNLSIEVLEKILRALEINVFDFFNESLKNEFQYNKYRDFYIKKIFKNADKWYLPDSGLWNERYIREMKPILTKKRTENECSIIERYIKDHSKKILDAPCGYGRISNLLSSKGYDITGIDINKYFINIAKTEETKQNICVKYFVTNIFDFNTNKNYDVVINIFTSIGYFESDEKNELFIKKLCSFVRQGGIFIIETINPFGVLKKYKYREKRMTEDGIKIVQERFFDLKTSTNIERISDYYPNGKIFKGLHRVRLYYPHELIKICKKYGLKNIDILDGKGEKRDILNSMRIWLIFKK